MDEDIDIEEHDLLDNPAMRSIFPDLSILKKEIMDYSDEVANVKHEQNELNITSETPIENEINSSETSFSALSNPINGLSSHNRDLRSPNPSDPENELLHKNKIILGTKPTYQYKIEISSDNETKKIFSSKVILEDIGLYLEKIKTFCNICQILFPEIKLLQEHNAEHHKKMVDCNSTVHRNSSWNTMKPRTLKGIPKLRNINNKCFHCQKSFPSKKSLVDHIYKILKTKHTVIKTDPTKLMNVQKNAAVTKTSQLITKMKNNTKKTHIRSRHIRTAISVKKDVLLYKCLYCGYYFVDIKFYNIHVQKKHRHTGHITANKILFDGHCKFCVAIHKNWKHYNIHLQQYHKNIINSIIKIHPKVLIPRLQNVTNKSIIDTSSQDILERSSDNGRDIMDVSDKLEIREDSSSNESLIDKMSPIVLSILFKCKRCDINFLTAKSARNHENHMEMLINWKCNICKRFFKQCDEFLHKLQHTHFSGHFTIYRLDSCELERVLYKCSKCTIHFNEDNYLSHYKTCEIDMAESVYCKVCDFLIDKCSAGYHHKQHNLKKIMSADFTIINSDAITIDRTRKDPINRTEDTKNINVFLELSYCESCKSFINQYTSRKDVHRKSRCAHLATRVCPYCGLVFTTRAMKNHQALHQQRRHLKLQDFSFYDLNTGYKTLPTFPQYPKCQQCEVHFISHVDHICSDLDFLTCHICNIKLSETLFKQHMSFHFYSKANDKITPSLSLNHKKITQSEDRYYFKSIKTKQMKRDRTIPDSIALTQETKKEIKIPSENQGITQIVDEETNKNRSNKNDADTTIEISETDIRYITPGMAKTKETHVSTSILKTDYELFGVLYCCVNCHTTLDTYDMVVEHCQDHLCGVQIETDTCETCKMTFERKSYSNHLKIHTQNTHKNTSKLLSFDIFYFTLDHSVWKKHVFRSLSEENIKLILNRSIYGSNKIKMKIIQNGFPELTVYKCDSCGVIIDSNMLDKHAETSCFKVRKHPCQICGLTFLSFVAKQKHRTIHTTGRNITQESYRIVLFNQENEKAVNNMLTKQIKSFILYQCRNCNGVIDKYQRANHKCNKNYLKKCVICDLMIVCSDYKAHVTKHNDVPDFIQGNMLVVLFGQTESNDNTKKNTLERFDGKFIDYTFYQCEICQVCFDKPQLKGLDHKTCTGTLSKSQCPKCNLFIPTQKMTEHTRNHENKHDFVRENMNILPYSINITQTTFTSAETNLKNNIPSKSNNLIEDTNKQELVKHDEVETLKNNNVLSEQTASLFKCDCGVHFLDKSSLEKHFYNCSSKTLNQQCWKCNLAFTPSVLFDHLLVHHADEKDSYIFNIIGLSKNEELAKQNSNKAPSSIGDITQNNKNAKDIFQDESIPNNISRKRKIIDSIQDTKEDELVINTNKDESTNIDLPDKAKDSKIPERSAKLLKCVCGLHFLDNSSIREHFDRCNPRITKQQCSKCNLVFTPSVLFDHLLLHHGNKDYSYTFNITEMSKKRCDIVTVYVCGKCNTHFVEYDNAKVHFEMCSLDETSVPENIKCKKCNLVFDICSIIKHQSEHHKDNVADIYIIDIETYRNIHEKDKSQRLVNSKANSNTLQADFVIERKWSISEDVLSLIDLSKYDNCLYKCEMCNTHFLTVSTGKRHFSNGHYLGPQDTCHICNLRFSLPSLTKHIYIHHKQMKLSFTDLVIKTNY